MTTSAKLTTPDRTPIGQVTCERTTYLVYDLGVGENSRRCGVVRNLALEGPKGALYMVTDHGPRYRLNVIACGNRHSTRRPSPSNVGNLRHLTRDDLGALAL